MNRYCILTDLEGGPFSRVMRVMDKEESELRVVKRMKYTSELDPLIHFLTTHQHARMCKVYDIFIENSYLYIVMESVESDLFDLIKGRDLNVKEIQKITKQLVDVLSYLSKERIAHCDIKLENVLVDDNMNIKLIDFDMMFYSYRVKCHEMRGTDGVAAPEVFSGLYDERVDMYGLGIIVAELFLKYNPLKQKSIPYLIRDCKKIPCDAFNFINSLVCDLESRSTIDEIKYHPFVTNIYQ